MTPELKNFLEYYLPHENLDPFWDYFHENRIKQNSFLLKPGQGCNFLAFIQHGCFRVFYYDMEGREVITWFSFEEMVITDMLAYYTTGVAKFYVEALEDSIIYTIARNDLDKLYRQNPGFLNFGRKLAEEALTMLMQRTMALHTKSAEERYMELLTQPEFMQKIPLKYLASYLGITDTSLSRIRKNIR